MTTTTATSIVDTHQAAEVNQRVIQEESTISQENIEILGSTTAERYSGMVAADNHSYHPASASQIFTSISAINKGQTVAVLIIV